MSEWYVTRNGGSLQHAEPMASVEYFWGSRTYWLKKVTGNRKTSSSKVNPMEVPDYIRSGVVLELMDAPASFLNRFRKRSFSGEEALQVFDYLESTKRR